MIVQKKLITPFTSPLETKLKGLTGWRDPANQVTHKPSTGTSSEQKVPVPKEVEHALAN